MAIPVCFLLLRGNHHLAGLDVAHRRSNFCHTCAARWLAHEFAPFVLSSRLSRVHQGLKKPFCAFRPALSGYEIIFVRTNQMTGLCSVNKCGASLMAKPRRIAGSQRKRQSDNLSWCQKPIRRRVFCVHGYDHAPSGWCALVAPPLMNNRRGTDIAVHPERGVLIHTALWGTLDSSALGEQGDKNFCWAARQPSCARFRQPQSASMARHALDDFTLMRAMRSAKLPILSFAC